MPALPDPPAYLSPASQAWWSAIVTEYELGPADLRVLSAAAQAWDRMTQAREALDADGLTVPTANGVKTHPAVAVEVQSRIAFLRAVRELRLEDLPEPLPMPLREVS